MKKSTLPIYRNPIAFLVLIAFFLFGEVCAQTVYVTKTGKKYHAEGCRYLRKSSYSMTLADATASGYQACSRCSGNSFVQPARSTTRRTELETRVQPDSPAGSFQCQGITKKGNRCSRKAKGTSGFCWQHGG